MRCTFIAWVLILGTILPVAAQSPAQSKPVPAPELAGGVGWLNHDAPVTLESLRGKIVLLDFWTYC